MAELLAEAYGGEVTVDRERVGITWAQFHTHLCHDFYSYQYATGIAYAHALANDVLDGDPARAARYLDFLRSGDSLFPVDALRLAGVDASSLEPLQRAFEVLSAYVTRLEALTAERQQVATDKLDR
jgi:oligoendopeptidase F